MRNRKSLSLLSLLFGFAALGCKSAPPTPPPATPAVAVAAAVAKVESELKLAPAQAASESLGMSVLVASPMKLVADLDSISKDLQLPMALGQSLLPMITSGAGPGGMNVSTETLARLDATRPLSVIWLVRGAQQPVGWCAALAFKDEKFAAQSLQVLGTAAEERAGAKHMKTPSGEMVWAAVAQRQLRAFRLAGDPVVRWRPGHLDPVHPHAGTGAVHHQPRHHGQEHGPVRRGPVGHRAGQNSGRAGERKGRQAHHARIEKAGRGHVEGVRPRA